MGMLYTGAMEKGQMHGKGSLVYANNEKYEGDFEYGTWRPNARRSAARPLIGLRLPLPCTEPARRAATGKRHGFGVYSYADGGTFEGEWIDDKVHGRGVSKYASGNRRGRRHCEGWEGAAALSSCRGLPDRRHAVPARHRFPPPRPAPSLYSGRLPNLGRLVLLFNQFCCRCSFVVHAVVLCVEFRGH